MSTTTLLAIAVVVFSLMVTGLFTTMREISKGRGSVNQERRIGSFKINPSRKAICFYKREPKEIQISMRLPRFPTLD